MFGISSGELFFIALIALIVLGPERLPKATRFAGLWVRRARTQWNSVKDELERELAADELKRSLQDARESVAEIERKMRESHAQTEREFDQLRNSVTSPHDQAEIALDETTAATPGTDAPPAFVEPEAAIADPALDAPLKPQGTSDAPRNA